MKQITITVFISLSIAIAYGQEMTKEQQQVVINFIDCIKSQKKSKLAAKISFPFSREYPIPPVKNGLEFLKRYEEIFDDKLIGMIVNSDPAKDWSAVGWHGIMLFRGDVWLDYDGRLIAVNYQSQTEAKKKEELIALEKSKLHESIRNFIKPVYILETAKYRIRIDELGANNFRYSSWALSANMNDTPDLIIEHGEINFAGSGGNHNYVFKNEDYVSKLISVSTHVPDLEEGDCHRQPALKVETKLAGRYPQYW